MSTVLKKRVIAEYNQIHQDEPQQKKFKHLLRPTASNSSGSAFIGLLETKTSSNGVLELLLRMAEALSFHEGEVQDAIEKLSQRFKAESESAVRAVILSIFADIGGVPDVRNEVILFIINETINLIQNEESHKVRTQGLSTLLRLGRKLSDDVHLHSKLVTQAEKFLKDVSPSVKCKCFEIIGIFLPIELDTPFCSKIMETISKYINSDDARVRASAFETMDNLHTRGLKLNASIYLEVCDSLKDDNARVRIAALKILWLLGSTYSEEIITSFNDEKLRLVDDAFGRICNCVCDLSVQVRVKAVSLLGQMKNVSLHYLEQTLEKKLMSNMRRRRTIQQRAQDSLAKGTWAPKQGSISDPSLERVDPDEVTIINQGACGAFAHGLEDEFLEVRSATIDALCELSGSSPKFALHSSEYLVDMFNDEIEEVRLKAIYSLAKISKDIVLREDQLDTILSVLEDSSMDVREGVHRILTSCRLATKDCLQMAVNDLLDSLKKYPQDRKSVWNCFQLMGSVHATLTLPLAPELLAIHPFYDTPEPNVDEPGYVSILLLVFNAAKHHYTMLQLFEERIIKHYSYLRDTMPHLVPLLPFGGNLTSSELKPVQTNTAGFLINMLKKIEKTDSPSVRLGLLEIAEKDLARLAQIDSHVTGAAQFLSLYISSQLKLVNVLKNKSWYSNATVEHQTVIVKNNIERLLQSVLKVQYLCIGLNNTDRSSIQQFKLKVLSLLLVYVVRATNQSARALCHYYLTQVDNTSRLLNYSGIVPDIFTRLVMKELSSLEECKPGTVARILLPILQKSTPMSPPAPNLDIKMTYAVINSPASGSDMVYSFTAGMVMGVQLDADLYNLYNPKHLRIKICYPDQQTHLLMPRINHLRPVTFDSDKSNTHRLVTTALISHQVWSDVGFVDLNLALDLTDMENMLSNCMRTTSHLCVLDLCKPIKIAIHPKEVKKGVI